ncbi:MAG: hypothetical protein ACRC42_03955 [Mycoplasma sp.]
MKSNIMKAAWEMARRAAGKFGGKSKDYFQQSMKIVWAQVKHGGVNVSRVVEINKVMNTLLRQLLNIKDFCSKFTKKATLKEANEVYLQTEAMTDRLMRTDAVLCKMLRRRQQLTGWRDGFLGLVEHVVSPFATKTADHIVSGLRRTITAIYAALDALARPDYGIGEPKTVMEHDIKKYLTSF